MTFSLPSLFQFLTSIDILDNSILLLQSTQIIFKNTSLLCFFETGFSRVILATSELFEFKEVRLSWGGKWDPKKTATRLDPWEILDSRISRRSCVLRRYLEQIFEVFMNFDKIYLKQMFEVFITFDWVNFLKDLQISIRVNFCFFFYLRGNI